MSQSRIRRGGIRKGESELAKNWERVIAEWSGSGLSQAEFCRRQGIKLANFGWWKRQLSIKAKSGNHSTVHPRKRVRGLSNSFVEVSMTDSARHSGYEVVLSGGRVIRLPRAFDAETVTQLIVAVEASC